MKMPYNELKARRKAYNKMNVNERYNALTPEQKSKVQTAVKVYHARLWHALQTAYFFNKIAARDISDYIAINN